MKFEIAMSDDLWLEKITRDLKFIVCEPLLLDLGESSMLQDRLREAVLRFLTLHPWRILQMIERPDARLPLGKWFERVFLLALRMAFPFAEIRHSVPDGQGGELDFIVRDGHSIYHIECAVKFFMRLKENGPGLESFVGPGGRDRLDLKFEKMRHVQLRRQIPSVEDRDRLIRVLWMSGRILLPLTAAQVSAYEFPAPINRRLNPGLWVSQDEFKGHNARNLIILALPRQWWITPLTGLTMADLNAFPRVTPDGQIEGPIMIAVMGIDSDSGVVIERQRLMYLDSQPLK